jgi:AAA domain
MNDRPTRAFHDEPAVRGEVPLLFGLIGPSGSGKTFSALRLATGMQKIFGGDIFVLDTEAGRATHYSDIFKFRHVPFSPPFSPLDYLDALKYCVGRGAKTIIVDSMSHEHSGQGGVLEWHDREVERLMKLWRTTQDKANMPAWGEPKGARREVVNFLTQSRANFILCFRAKDKVQLGDGKVVKLGWMPDAGEEYVFELTAKSLLLPGAGGVPTWESDLIGEKLMIKLPEYFRKIFSGAANKPLDEEIGETIAKWAAGKDKPVGPPFDVELLLTAYAACATQDRFAALEQTRNAAWGKLKGPDKQRLKAASDAAKDRLAGAAFETAKIPAETAADEPT